MMMMMMIPSGYKIFTEHFYALSVEKAAYYYTQKNITHTHTHTHTYIYIYIYIERERERGEWTHLN